MAQLNHTHRVVVFEMLGTVGAGDLVRLEHELYRLAHVYRDGLTDKEYQFIMNRCQVLKDELPKYVKLRDRVKGTLDGRLRKD